jgi:hypothetical protein
LVLIFLLTSAKVSSRVVVMTNTLPAGVLILKVTWVVWTNMRSKVYPS